MAAVSRHAWGAVVALAWLMSGFEAVSAPVLEADRGRLLYENHCTACHTSVAHIRAGRKVHSVDEIRKQVLRWSGHQNLQWRTEEISAVVDYLNRTYYQFGAP